MASLSEDGSEILVKVVLWGPEGSGKSSFLASVTRVWSWNEPVAISLPTDDASQSVEREAVMVAFPEPLADLLVTLDIIATRGAPGYVALRTVLLRDADLVIFVADSTAGAIGRNHESYEELAPQLDGRPYVLCCNKRDLRRTIPIAKLERAFGGEPVPNYECIAIDDVGVLDTVKTILKLVSIQLRGSDAR